MSAHGAILRGRRMAESLMRDTVLVERKVGETTATTPPFATVATWETVYSGKAKFQTDQTYEINNDVGESIRTSSRSELHVPVEAFKAEPGMRVTVVSCAGRPSLNGTKWLIAEPLPPKSFTTADRHSLEGEING